MEHAACAAQADFFPLLRQTPHDNVRSPSTVELEGLRALMAASRYQDAILRARSIYCIHVLGGFATKYVGSDRPYPDDAITLPDVKTIRVTVNAFVSPAWLARTLLHERVHVEQYLRGDWGAEGSAGDNLNEVEAYDRVRRVAKSLGLSRKERATDDASRLPYYRALDASYRLRLTGGSYEVKDQDRAESAPRPGTR